MTGHKTPWPALCAFAVTTCAMIIGSAGGPSFLDSGELIAAARELGGIHPPGHPGYMSIAPIAEWLPWGPYGARLVWVSALLAGLSAALVSRIADRWLGYQMRMWALAAGLTVGMSASLWQVGIRAEVYTLALATNLWAIDAALRARALTTTAPERAVAASAEVIVAFCLGLLNHHYVALFQLPALIYAGAPALRLLARRRPALIGLLVMAVFIGCAYLYLPLRALSGAEMRWADPVTPGGIWDTVTARHFQRSVSESNVSVVGNLVLLLSTVVEGMGTWLGLAGLLGVVALFMKARTYGMTLVLCALGGLLTKALMQVDANNPDDHGYILMAPAAISLGIAGLARSLFGDEGLLPTIAPERRRRLSSLIVPWVLVLAALSGAMRTTSSQTWQADQHGSDWIDHITRKDMAPGAVYLSNYYGLQFNEAAWRIAEGRRPDLVASHLSFRTGDTDGGRGFARWFKRRHPGEAALGVAAYKLGKTPVGNILERLEGQLIYAEQDPDLRLPSVVYGFDGVAHRLLPAKERTLEYNLKTRRERQKKLWAELYKATGPVEQLDHQTRSVLLWQHALQMAHALRRGWRGMARDELERAKAISPKDTLLRRLEARLQLLDGAWRDGDAARFHRLWQGYATMDLDALTKAP